MKKFRTIIDMKKEEHYLKEMAEQGWGLVNYNSWNRYTFDSIAPETRNYRIDYQTFKTKADYIAYLTLFEDSGWQHVSGSQRSGIHIFLPVANIKPDSDIFSDEPSRNARYKRLYKQALATGILGIIYVMILQPSYKGIFSWYLAPTIWDYKGLQLVGMVVMETFFLILPLIPLFYLMISAVYYTVVGTQAKKLMTNEERR